MTAKTVAQLLAEVAANFPDNTSGQITPAVLRATIDDIVNSYINTVDLVPLAATGQFGLAKPDGTTVTASGGVLTAVGGGGAPAASTMLSFGTVSEAMGAIIPDAISTVYVAGYATPGDGGSGYYSRVSGSFYGYGSNTLPSFYVESPYYPRPFFPPVPPSFASGVPNIVYANTFGNRGGYGPTSAPIVAGSLAIIVATDIPGPPSQLLDSSGNIYLRAVTATGGGQVAPQAIYYCSNPIYAPIGTTFIGISGGAIAVYSIPGFTGAVLDVTASQVNASSVNGASLTTGTLTASPSLVIGFVNTGASVGSTLTPAANYVTPAGWSNITCPSTVVNPINCIAQNSNAAVTFNPTWSGTVATVVLIATFKTFNRTVLNPSSWQLDVEWPFNVARYGILPNTGLDLQIPYQRLGTWLASVLPPSDTGDTPIPEGFNDPIFQGTGGSYDIGTGHITLTGVVVPSNGHPFYNIAVGDYIRISSVSGTGVDLASLNDIWQVITGTGGSTVVVQGIPGKTANPSGGGIINVAKCTISAANPAVITIYDPRFTATAAPGVPPFPHRKKQGQFVSFKAGLTTGGLPGSLPAPLVEGQRYNLLYGTLTPTSFQISNESLFGGTGTGAGVTVGATGFSNSYKGAAVSTNGGTQAGMHSYTFYGEDWAEVVFPPGIYFSDGQQLIAGFGIRKLRIKAYGARFQTTFDLGFGYSDPNAATNGTSNPYWAPIQTTSQPGAPTNSVQMLAGSEALAANFYPNSWALLMMGETLGGTSGPWSEHTFEYLEVRSVDPVTGIILFWDNVRYNYRQTMPKYNYQAWLAGPGIGPGTLVQLPETFDQQIELYGASMYGVSEMDFICIASMRMVDCYVDGWAFKSGPTPSVCKKWVAENCVFKAYVPEIDKNIDYLAFTKCRFEQGSYLLFQSPSVNTCILEDNHMPTGISGTPKNLVVKKTFMGPLVIGPVTGSTESITIDDNSTVLEIVSSQQQGQAFAIYNTVTGVITTGLSFVGGTLKIADGTNGWHRFSSGNPVTGPPFPWALPGAKVAIYGVQNVLSGGAALGIGVQPDQFLDILTCFTVLDAYEDASGNFCADTDLPFLPTATASFTATISGSTMSVSAISTGSGAACLLQSMVITQTSGGSQPAGTIIQTDLGTPNLSGGIGNYTLSGSPTAVGSPQTFTATTPIFFTPHPCPRVTVSGSTGGKFVSDQVGAPTDIPLLSYFKRAFNGLSMNVNFPHGYVQIVGNLTSWTINVTKPYSGAMASFVAIIYMGGWAIEGSGPNLYFKVIKQVIDLKTAGLRTITANGTSGAVAPSGTASVTSLTWSSTSGGQVAVVMASPSSYVLGDTINVSGATNSGTGSLSLLNTTHTINTWTNSTHFTFKLPGTGAIWGTLGGTILLQIGGDSISAVPFWLVGGHPVVIGPTNDAGDTLGNGYRMVMVAQTDQGVDAASIILNNVATGSGVTLDEFADTVVAATLEGP